MRRDRILLAVLVVLALAPVVWIIAAHKPDQPKASVHPSATPAVSYDDTLKQSQSLVAKQEYAKAEVAWETFLSSKPSKEDGRKAYDQEALIYDKLKDYVKEMNAYRSAIKLTDSPSFTEENGLGNSCMKAFFDLAAKPDFDKETGKGYLNTAIAAYDVALPLAPDSRTSQQVKSQQAAAKATLAHL